MDDSNIIKSVDEEVVEAEVVDVNSDQATSSNPANDAATVSLSLENLIKGHIVTIGKLKSELAEHNDTLNNVLENDPTYKQHAEDAKKAAKVKTGTKAEIMKRPDVLQVANKIKVAREEYKEQQQTLSDLLSEYQRTTGQDHIELENGQVRRIQTTSRLTG